MYILYYTHICICISLCTVVVQLLHRVATYCSKLLFNFAATASKAKLNNKKHLETQPKTTQQSVQSIQSPQSLYRVVLTVGIEHGHHCFMFVCFFAFN